MKTYESLVEEISAERLAQLRAKGKGAAAEAKMKHDGLKEKGKTETKVKTSSNTPPRTTRSVSSSTRSTPSSPKDDSSRQRSSMGYKPKQVDNAKAREIAKNMMNDNRPFNRGPAPTGASPGKDGKTTNVMKGEPMSKAKPSPKKTKSRWKFWEDYRDRLLEATTGDLRQMGATPAQIAKLKQRREKRGFGFDRGDDRAGKKTPTSKPKALPAAADKGSAIVRQKQGGTGKEAIGGNRKVGGAIPQPKPDNTKGPGSKTYDRAQPGLKGGPLSTKVKPEPKPKRKSVFRDAIKQGATGGLMGGSENDRREAKRKLGNKIGTGIRNAPGKALGAAGKAVGSVANSARGTIQDKGEKMQDAKVTPVKRGLYNP